MEDLARALVERFLVGVNHDFCRQWLLIRVRHARKLGDFAAQRFGVQTLRVALDQHIQRAAHEHFDKATDVAACLVADLAIRRDRGNDGDAPAAADQFGDVRDAADIGVAIFLGKTEAFAEVFADIVSVEDLDVPLAFAQRLLQRVGKRALARAGEASKPDREAGGRFVGH